jgi:hypothetical protein
MSKAARVIAYGSAALLVLLGIAAGIVVGGTVGPELALVLIGLGLLLATALVFYEVGLSEDRERAREEAEKAPATRAKPTPPRFHLQRRRGQRRRLR